LVPLVWRYQRVHRILSPTFVTIAKRPSLIGPGRGGLLKVICPTAQEKFSRHRAAFDESEIGWLANVQTSTFPRIDRAIAFRGAGLQKETNMSRQDDNKAIVGRWFTEFWGQSCNLGVVDELAAPDMLLQYSLHEPRKGREDIRAFMTDFRKAFPDLNFWGTADLIAEGDYVVGRWEGGGTHTGPAFGDFLAGSLPANTGRKMRFTGTTVLKLANGKIIEEIGLDDGVTALQQLGLIKLAA
jgi:predicted ester cyclase